MGFGVIIANILKKAKVPDALFLLLLGLVLGPTLFKSPIIASNINLTLVDVSVMGNIPDFLRTLALVLVVFTGTFNLNLRVFKKFSDISINLAFIGVIFNTVAIGIFAMIIFKLEPIFAFLLSAVIAGTATEVIYPFEHALKDEQEALTTLKMESIFNSPLTVLLPALFIDVLTVQSGVLIEPLRYMALFWQRIAAGVGTGILVGYSLSKLLKGMLKEYTPLLLLSIALITYALAENVGGSGMLAVAVCGLIAGNMTFPQKKEVKRFDDYFSEMLRISVFTMMGAQIYLNFSITQILVTLIFFILVILIRPLFVIPLLKKLGLEFSTKGKLMLCFITPRGMSSAAMAPIIVGVLVSLGKNEIGNFLMNTIFLCILFSILFSTIIANFISKNKLPSFGFQRFEFSKESKAGDFEEIKI